MNYSILNYQHESGIGILTISRPEALNALNSLFFKEFNDFLNSIQSSKTLKVLIITGEGKSFVAGADISEMQKMKVREGLGFSKTGQETFGKLVNLEIPVIAAVNGFALGGGCELAMACDFRIASSKAKFGMPEVSLGLIPGYGGTQRLSRLVGLGDALYLVLTGQIIDSSEALRIGLVQKVVEAEVLLLEAKNIATKIAAQSPVAIKTAKKVIRKGYNVEIDKGFELEAESFSKMFENDGSEGMKAFLEKRKPNWN
ncbi:MAG: crotonase [Bacteroidales bacterium]|nr:crotonase [Bacteroidales bacterium]